MHFLRAADEAHRGHAVAVAVERLLRRLDELRVVGEAEIVVGAEVDDFDARPHPLDRDMRALGRQDRAFVLGQAFALDALECCGRRGKDGTVHGLPLE